MQTKDIKNILTVEQVQQLLITIGIPTESIMLTNFGFIMPTYCHNNLMSDAKQKLYYYDNSKLFKCYTECDSSFDIFELYIKIQQNFFNKQINLYEAIDFVHSFFGFNNFVIDTTVGDFDYLNKFLPKQSFEQTKPKDINEDILQIFSNHQPIEWTREGINYETFKLFNIKYQLFDERIIIPHKDINGRMVGIRVRNLQESDIQFRGKYCPLYYGNTLFNHPLSLHLYGLYENRTAIQNAHTAIIFEGEKSVLKLHSYLPDFSIGVAVCGSNISDPQVQLLIKYCKVNNIIIAFDKEYENSHGYDKYITKIYKIAQKIKPYANVFIMADRFDMLGYKDSPIDKGLDTFQFLYNKKITI
jgi:hypothetical protein